MTTHFEQLWNLSLKKIQTFEDMIYALHWCSAPPTELLSQLGAGHDVSW